jgi:outer membrane protein assembly factor BamB
VDLGEGHAAPAVAHGRVYLLDYDEKSKADMLRCFALSDGRELWRRGYKVEVKRNHGRSRTISAVTDRFCVTIGPRCHVMCVHPFTGEFKWGIDLKKEYGTEVPLWYTGQCPLIDDTVAVIAPAGNALMIGVDCATGTVLWKTPNPDGWKMSHSSVIPGNFHGRKVYLYCAIGGIAGIAADGDNRGNVLFSSNAFNKSVIAPSPVILGDNRIFVTAGYGAGSMLFRVTRKNGEYSMNVEKEYGVKKGFASEQQTPVYYNGYLYGIMPKDAGELRNQLVCVHPNTPDKVEWSSGKERRFGLGPYLVADGKIFVFNEDGELTVVEATHRRFTKFGSVQLMDGIDAWAPLALTEGLLLVRDAKKMLCVNIREKSL